MVSDKVVCISAAEKNTNYSDKSPFLPSENYPEIKNRISTGDYNNDVYKLFRQLLFSLGMDIENFATQKWNPFKGLIKPGDKVLIKPNLVRHLHLAGGDYNSVITHPSLIRCVLDYAALALNGEGEITVGDAPVQSTDFQKLVDRTNLYDVCKSVESAWNIPVYLKDFRLWQIKLNKNHRIENRKSTKGDANGYYAVDLGKNSCLFPISQYSEKYRVAFYDPREMNKHHNTEINEYLLPKSVLDADVIINLPKLKTHRKVGMTAALKNLVGINGHKDWLPHHRIGCISENGDEYKYPSLIKKWQTKFDEHIHKNPESIFNNSKRFTIRLMNKIFKDSMSDQYHEGSWYGNDTLWRTVLDLNRLLVYADQEKMVNEIPQRKCISFVDAIIAGEGEGPMEPDARPIGILVGGVNPVAVDAVLATLIGFDYLKMPLIENGFKLDKFALTDFKADDIEIVSNDNRFKNLKVGDKFDEFCFEPSAGWKGFIENNECFPPTNNQNKSAADLKSKDNKIDVI